MLLRVNPNLSEELVKISARPDNSQSAGGLLSELSDALTLIYAGVGQLRNAQGEIEIPVTVEGVLPHLSIRPDKEYLTQKLVAPVAQQLVVKQVRNFLDKPVAAGESGVQNSMDTLLGSKGGLKNLFSQVIAQDNSEGKQR